LLLCKQNGCIWHLVYLDWFLKDAAPVARTQAENPMPTLMPKIATIALPSSVTLFGRFMALIDRALMAHARIANRNGDLPRFGL
jgi:hypothetical protein